MAAPAVKRAIGEAERRLGGHGRLVVRASGTEPLIRVMVEAEDEALMATIADEVSAAIAEAARAHARVPG
jgi:phosphoglucosamine mutase